LIAGALAGAAVLAGLGWWLARRALPSGSGRLRWDGQAWSSISALGLKPVQRLVVALDLGNWVLLRLHLVGGGAVWRVASAASAQSAWHGLRVALAAYAGAAPAAAGESAA
jgi:hypothetical protein